MTKVISKILTAEEMDELRSQLEPREELQFMFKSNCSPIEKDRGERYHCKNGHFNFISNYMGFHPDTVITIRCEECDEVILEYKPYAVRIRELQIIKII